MRKDGDHLDRTVKRSTSGKLYVKDGKFAQILNEAMSNENGTVDRK